MKICTPRDNSIVCLKGFCILLVVFGHLPMTGLWHGVLLKCQAFVYTYHIFIFVFLTGFLFAHKIDGGLAGVVKVARRMFKPYIVGGVVFSLLYATAGFFGVSVTNNVPQGVWHALVSILTGYAGGALWYLYVFGIAEAAVLLLWKILRLIKDEKQRLLVTCCCALAMICYMQRMGFNMFASWTGFFFFGVIVGFFVDMLPRSIWFLFPLILTYPLVSKYWLGAVHYVYVLSVVVFILGAFDRVQGSRLYNFFGYFGSKTLPILIFHPIANSIGKILSNRVLQFEPTGLALACLTFLISVAACLVIDVVLAHCRVKKFFYD